MESIVAVTANKTSTSRLLDVLVAAASTTPASPPPGNVPFHLTTAFVVVLVVVVAVVFLLLGVVLYKVYSACSDVNPAPSRGDSHRWLTEDNPLKWTDSNYDVTQEDVKKTDLPHKKPRTGDSESGSMVEPGRPGRRLHRPSLSA